MSIFRKATPLVLGGMMMSAAISPAAAERVQISGSGETFGADISRTELSAQLLDRLPLELSMSSLYSFLIYGDRAIDAQGSFRRGLKKGDIVYCTYGYFIILTEDQPASNSSRFIKVGQIDSADTEKLDALADGGTVRIEGYD